MRILIDANLLVLYVVGRASRDYIEKRKRLSEYVAEDYDTLLEVMSRADEVVVTPHILAEASNLAA